MPSNTGHYNDDADADNLTDELSPTDGYFNQRPPHPQDVLIPDPSQQSSAAADKAREAREDGRGAGREGEAASERAMEEDGRVREREVAQQHRRTSHTIPSPSTGLYESTHDVEQYSEHSPLLLSAPPAYSTVPAGSGNPGNNSGSEGRSIDSGGYSMTAATGHLGLYRQYDEPQSMGVPVNPDIEAHGWRRRSRRCMVGRCSLKYLVKLLFLVGLVAVGIGFIIHVVGNIPTKKVKLHSMT